MRPALAGALTISALLINTSNASCACKNNDEIVKAVGCGDAPSILECLNPADFTATTTESLIQLCLLSLGCTREQAQNGQYWLEEDCSDEAYPETQDKPKEEKPMDAGSELRRRAAVAIPPPFMTPAALLPRETQLVCLTTSMTSVTWCSTSTVNNVEASACTPTETAVVNCAPGLICATPAQGPVVCMVRKNSLDTGGLIVTIGFATVIAIMIGSLLFMCFSARKASRAAKIKRDSIFSKKALESEADLPLMQQAGGAGGVGGGAQVDDFGGVPLNAGGHRVPSNTYGESVGAMRGAPPPVPKLHPGLVSTPGGSYGPEDDISYGRR